MSDKEESDDAKNEEKEGERPTRRAKKDARLTEILMRKEARDTRRKINQILKKTEEERTEEENKLLKASSDVVRAKQKSKALRQKQKSRVLEVEDSEDVLQKKCMDLAEVIRTSRNIVIYTGAGISTAASIPDYRGPNGVWTMLQKGEQPVAQDLSDAEPTRTHMCIMQLYREGHVRHVVSQNCDGLHLRSGLNRRILSEVHGNMYIELCHKCRPSREYVRLFDVTEKTGVRRHQTDRKCHKCKGPLRDTIVHFGEKGGMRSPYRWKEAARAADKADVILCLGSSLKILRRYACLWCMDRSKNKRPKLIIVNLQWTPKDDAASLKINGRCDDVMQRVMSHLGYEIPAYEREADPIFRLSSPLREYELDSTCKKILQRPDFLKRPPSQVRKVPKAFQMSESVSSTDSDSNPTTLTQRGTLRNLLTESPLQEQMQTSQLFLQAAPGNLCLDETKKTRRTLRHSSQSASSGYSRTNTHATKLKESKQDLDFLQQSLGYSGNFSENGSSSSICDTPPSLPQSVRNLFAQLQETLNVYGKSGMNQNMAHSLDTLNSQVPLASAPNMPALPQFTMCQSCVFLKGYGITKKKCSLCNDLRAQHAAVEAQWRIAFNYAYTFGLPPPNALFPDLFQSQVPNVNLAAKSSVGEGQTGNSAHNNQQQVEKEKSPVRPVKKQEQLIKEELGFNGNILGQTDPFQQFEATDGVRAPEVSVSNQQALATKGLVTTPTNMRMKEECSWRQPALGGEVWVNSSDTSIPRDVVDTSTVPWTSTGQFCGKLTDNGVIDLSKTSNANLRCFYPNVSRTQSKPLDMTLASSCSPLDMTLTSVPYTIDGTLTAVPTTIDKTLTAVPKAMDKTLTAVPKTIDTTLTSMPKAMDRTLTEVPKTIDRMLKAEPEIIDRTLTSMPKAMDRTLTEVPKTIDRMLKAEPLTIDRTVKAEPKAIDMSVTEGSKVFTITDGSTNPLQNPIDVDNMLIDHFYLKPTEMQKLSPNRDRKRSLTDAQSSCDSMQMSPVKKLNFEDLDDVSSSQSISSGAIVTSTICATSSSTVPETVMPSVSCTVSAVHRSHSESELTSMKDPALHSEMEPFSNDNDPQTSTQLSNHNPSAVTGKRKLCEYEDLGSSNTHNGVCTSKKLLRSLSQDDGGSALDVDSTGSNGGVEEPDTAQKPKKKFARCLSVPGWFGKGLNLKKKRRF